MENPDTKKDEVKAYRLSEYGFDDPFRPKNLRHLGLKMIEHYTDSYDIITSREVNKMFLAVHEKILKKLDTEDPPKPLPARFAQAPYQVQDFGMPRH